MTVKTHTCTIDFDFVLGQGWEAFDQEAQTLIGGRIFPSAAEMAEEVGRYLTGQIIDPMHLADVLRRATPAARDAIKGMSETQLGHLLDDDKLLNAEPEWTLPEVMDYTNGTKP